MRLPEGLFLDSVLDSTSFPWMVRTFGQFRGDTRSMHPGSVVAVNPLDGSVERIISYPDKKTRVLCEKNGTFLGFTLNEDLGVFERRTGSIQR